MIGWTCFTGWQGAILSTSFLAGTIIQGLFALNMPNYVFERWHGTLLVIGIIAFSMLFNTFLAKKLPMIENLVLVLYIVGFFATIIPLWVLAPRNSAKSVFLEFSNGGNWSSTGTSVMIGLLGPVTSMLGFDCMVHMCELDYRTCWQPLLTSRGCSRRSQGRRHHITESHDVVRLSQLRARLSNTPHDELHPW